jgi:hypothetical protein
MKGHPKEFEHHSNAHGYNLEDCEDLRKEVTGLAERGIIRKKIVKPIRECMMINRVSLHHTRKLIFRPEWRR